MSHTGSWAPVSALPWLKVAGARCGWAGAPLPCGMCPFQVGTKGVGTGLREPLNDVQELYSQGPALVLLISESLF